MRNSVYVGYICERLIQTSMNIILFGEGSCRVLSLAQSFSSSIKYV